MQFLSRYQVSTSLPLLLPHWLKSEEVGCQTTQSHHHVVALDVIVMGLMLKCMQTSNVQTQASNQVWSSCFAVLVMFIFCGHFVTHFDRHGGRAGQDQSTQDQEDHQVNDEDDKHIIIWREKKVQMESQSQRRSRCQYVCSRSSGTSCSSTDFV